jgi:hypothetical protein
MAARLSLFLSLKLSSEQRFISRACIVALSSERFVLGSIGDWNWLVIS